MNSSTISETPCHIGCTAAPRSRPSRISAFCLLLATSGTCARQPEATRLRAEPFNGGFVAVVALVGACRVRERPLPDNRHHVAGDASIAAINAAIKQAAEVQLERGSGVDVVVGQIRGGQ